MNVDFCEGTYEGIRRLLPLLTDTADRGDLRRVAMSERRNSGRPVWRFPETWKIKSTRRYWKRTVAPLLEAEYKGFGLRVATHRYINPYDIKQTRTGAEITDDAVEDVSMPSETPSSNPRLYPAGKRLSRGEETKERLHSPQDERGKNICWDFNSNGGCFRGVTCMNSHARMKPGPSRWCLQAELIRRGGNRRSGKHIPPHEIDGMVRQLREQSKREEEEKRVSVEANGTYDVEHDVSEHSTLGNPVIPNAAEGFGDFDFTQAETRARQLFYASDQWADVRDVEGIEEFVDETETTMTEGPETWYRTQDRPLPASIEQFVLNWLVLNAELKDWEVGIVRALEIVVAKGTKKISQIALAELTVRQSEQWNRTGEICAQVSWTAVTDMGDVNAQQLTLGGVGFTILDYGGRLNITRKMRLLLHEGNNMEKNQCAITHLAAGAEWHLQKRPNRFPLKARVMSLAAELRIHEYDRPTSMMGNYPSADGGSVETRIVRAVCHDVINANRDRDFIFRPLFSGEEIGDHQLCIRIVEINSQETRTRVYNYQSGSQEDPDKVIYLLAHRGHMRFVKPSRLTTETRWKKWRTEFSQVIELEPIKWDGLQTIRDLLRMEESRQRRHCRGYVDVRLQYPGMCQPHEMVRRMAGHHSKRQVRTDADRRLANQKWVGRYNQLLGTGEQIEMPGRSRSIPTIQREDLKAPTGMVEERDIRAGAERHHYVDIETAGFPKFYPPPQSGCHQW